MVLEGVVGGREEASLLPKVLLAPRGEWWLEKVEE